MRSRAWGIVVALVLALAGWAAPAVAADPKVIYPAPLVKVYADLDFEREPSASICPGEQMLRDLLMAQMGSDPFEADPEGVYVGRIHVVLSRAPGGFAGAYTWVDTEGTENSDRIVHRGACLEALQAVATVLWIKLSFLEEKLGQRYAKTTPPPYCPAPPPQTTAACAESESKTAPLYSDSRFAVWPTEWPLPPLEKPKPDPPPPPDRAPLAIRFGATVGPELVATGWGSFGFAADAGVRYHAFSVGIEAHGDPPLGSVSYPQAGPVNFARVSGAALLCGHVGWFVACGVGDVGRFILTDRAGGALPASVLYGAAGVRASLEFPIVPSRAFFRVGMDLRAPIHPASFTHDDAVIFQAAGPGVGVGIGLVTELPLWGSHGPPSLAPASHPGDDGEPASNTTIGHVSSGPHGS